MNSEDLIKELKELKEMINQSSEHTQRQLQNIDSNLLIGSLASFIFALGISSQLQILIYWIPASFLLIYLWAFYDLFLTRGTFAHKNIEKTMEAFQEQNKNKLTFAFIWAFKLISPIITAVSLIYIVTLIVLLLIVNKTITVNQSFHLLIPTISASSFALLPFFFDNLIKFAEEGKFYEYFSMLSKLREEIKPSKWQIILGSFRLVFLIIYMPITVVLPVWAFWITHSIISDPLFLIIVLVLQCIVIIISASYFSSLSVKKELTNTLTNFADIDYQINNLILNKNLKKERIEKLKTLYLTAKQYDVIVSDSLKFVNFYYISMNRVYLNKE